MPVSAGLEGNDPFICASAQVLECVAEGACQNTPPEEIGAPRFFKVDLSKKLIENADVNGDKRTTVIGKIMDSNDRVVLNGVEDSGRSERGTLGWSAVIARDTGLFTLTANDDRTAFIIFGHCMRP